MLRVRVCFRSLSLVKLVVQSTQSQIKTWRYPVFQAKAYFSTIKPQPGTTEWFQERKSQILDENLLFEAKNSPFVDSPFLQVARSINRGDIPTFLAEIGKIDKAERDINQNTLLHWAARSGNKGVTKLLLELGLDVNAKNSRGSTALMLAAAKDNVECMKELIDFGADLTAQDLDGYSVLQKACIYDAPNAVQLLIEKGIDVNRMEGSPDSMSSVIEYPLFSPQICKLLLEAGAKVDRYLTLPGDLLHMVVQVADPEVVKMIIEAVAKCKKSDGTTHSIEEILEKRGKNSGLTLLSIAASEGKEDTMKVLLEMGAKINAKQINPKQQDENMLYSPIRCAIKNQHMACVRLLLKSGAEVNMVDLIAAIQRGNAELVQIIVVIGKVDVNSVFDDLTPLMNAAMHGQLEVVKILEKLGANLDAEVSLGKEQANAFTLAALSSKENVVRYFWKEKKMELKAPFLVVKQLVQDNNISGLEKLVEMGINLSKMKSEQLYILLHTAAARNYAPAIDLLAKLGLEIDSKFPGTGNSPLMMAAYNGSLNALKKLIELKADVNAKCGEGKSAMCYAKNPEIIQILYNAGADVNNAGGIPPLREYASSSKSIEHAQKILDLGADINIEGPTGTPIMLAAVAGNLPLVRFFMSRGANPDGKFHFNFGPRTMGITEMAVRAAGEGRGSLELVEECYKYETEKRGKLGLGPLLIYTAHYGFAPFVSKLLQMGAPVDTTTPPNDTSALHVAASINRPEVVKVLLQGGANQDLKTKNGMTALDIAKSKNFQEIIQLLDNK